MQLNFKLGYESVQTGGAVISNDSTTITQNTQTSVQKSNFGEIGEKLESSKLSINLTTEKNSGSIYSGYGGSGYRSTNPGYRDNNGSTEHNSAPSQKIKTLPGKQICSPGKIYKDKCNICKCSVDGNEASCSKKECIDELKEGITNYFYLLLIY